VRAIKKSSWTLTSKAIYVNLRYNADVSVERVSADDLLSGVDEFFMALGPVHKTVRRLAQRMSAEGIEYVLVGGMALVFHGYRRETVDVDIILDEHGRERFVENVVGRGYVQLFPGAKKRFRDSDTGVEIDVLIHGDYPGDGKRKPVVVPRPQDVSTEIDGIRVITLEKLIELKLASGISASDRLRDLADVQELIKIKKLDSQYTERLDPYVRDKYIELWKGVASAPRQTDQD
jgi:hypothetical protein